MIEMLINATAAIMRRIPSTLPKREGIMRRLNRIAMKDGHHVRLVRMRGGHRMRVDLRSGTEYRAFYTGEYDAQIMETVLRLIEPKSAVVDVGANVGFWSVPLAIRSEQNDGCLIAVEPAPSNFERLRENLQLNGLTEVTTLLKVGLSDHTGEARLSLREDFEAGSLTGNAAIVNGETKFKTVCIPLQRADDVLPAISNLCCSLIKLDIEGHEGAFLRGARQFISKNRPIIVCELNRACVQDVSLGSSADVEGALLGLNYTFARREFGKFAQVDRFASPLDLDDLLLIPAERIDDVLRRVNSMN